MDFGDQIMDDIVEGLVQNIGRLVRTLEGRPGHHPHPQSSTYHFCDCSGRVGRPAASVGVGHLRTRSEMSRSIVRSQMADGCVCPRHSQNPFRAGAAVQFSMCRKSVQGDANRCSELGVGPKDVEELTMEDQFEGYRRVTLVL